MEGKFGNASWICEGQRQNQHFIVASLFRSTGDLGTVEFWASTDMGSGKTMGLPLRPNAPHLCLWRPPLETIREEDHNGNHEDEEYSSVSLNFENVKTWRGTPSRRVRRSLIGDEEWALYQDIKRRRVNIANEIVSFKYCREKTIWDAKQRTAVVTLRRRLHINECVISYSSRR